MNSDSADVNVHVVKVEDCSMIGAAATMTVGAVVGFGRWLNSSSTCGFQGLQPQRSNLRPLSPSAEAHTPYENAFSAGAHASRAITQTTEAHTSHTRLIVHARELMELIEEIARLRMERGSPPFRDAQSTRDTVEVETGNPHPVLLAKPCD